MSQTKQSKPSINLCWYYQCAITNDTLNDDYKWHTLMGGKESKLTDAAAHKVHQYMLV